MTTPSTDAVAETVKHCLRRTEHIPTRLSREDEPDRLLAIRPSPDMFDTGLNFAVAIGFAARALCPPAGLEVPEIPDERGCESLLRFGEEVSGPIAPIASGNLTRTVSHTAGKATLEQGTGRLPRPLRASEHDLPFDPGLRRSPSRRHEARQGGLRRHAFVLSACASSPRTRPARCPPVRRTRTGPVRRRLRRAGHPSRERARLRHRAGRGAGRGGRGGSGGSLDRRAPRHDGLSAAPPEPAGVVRTGPGCRAESPDRSRRPPSPGSHTLADSPRTNPRRRSGPRPGRRTVVRGARGRPPRRDSAARTHP